MRVLGEFLLQGATTAVITLTISKGEIFEPLRESFRFPSPWIHKLLTCPYCLAHWVALFLTLALPFPSFLSFLLTLFPTIFLACPLMAVITFSMAQVGIYSGGSEEE